jgi:hypothetical protein
LPIRPRATEVRILSKCGVIIGGSGRTLDTPASSWASALVTPSADSPALLEEVHDSPAEFSLRHESCAPVELEDFCARITSRLFDGPDPTSNLRSVAVISSDLAVVGSRSEVRPFERTVFAVTSTGGFSSLATPELLGNVRLGWDGLETLYAMNGTTLFEMTSDTNLKRVYEAPPGATELAVGKDGTAIVYGLGPAFELGGSSTQAKALSDFPEGVLRLHIVSRDQMVALTTESIQTYDGAIWTVEMTGLSFEAVRLVGGTEMLVVGSDVGFFRRVGSPPEWEPLPVATPLEPRAITSFDGCARRGPLQDSPKHRQVPVGHGGRVKFLKPRPSTPTPGPGSDRDPPPEMPSHFVFRPESHSPRRESRQPWFRRMCRAAR